MTGAQLKARRENLNLSLRKAAYQLGVHHTTLMRMESKTHLPRKLIPLLDTLKENNKASIGNED